MPAPDAATDPTVVDPTVVDPAVVAPADAPTDDEPTDDAPTDDPRDEASEPRGTRLDDWWARMLAVPWRRTMWIWGAPIAVTLLAAVLRFWNLGHPQQLVFDETYYVKDAWTLWHRGSEAQWPSDFDDDFANGDTMGFLDDPSYVVHPPLGKWLLGLGMAVFGAGDPFWWRAATALAGTLAVLLLALVARRMFRSTLLAVIAGLLLAVDGNAIVMSRVALLDTWLMLLLLLGFWFVLLDRDRSAGRLAERLALDRADGRDPHYGPTIWARPWVIAAGAAFGAACAVKWSGIWYVAAFGLYLVIVDAVARRRERLPFWLTGALVKQAPATFLLFVPVAVAVYLASWTGWLVTDGGYYRDWAAQPGNAATGLFGWVPLALQSLWHYHEAAYQFHVGLHSEHPWQANPWTWLVMGRPTNMYYREVGCAQGSCVESIMGIGNALIWWAAAIAIVYLVYRLVRYREWQVGAILLAIGAGYLPWLAYPERTVFQFYTIAFQPYTTLALVFVLGLILGSRADPTWRRTRGLAVTGVYLLGVLVVSAFFYPLWAAIPIDATVRQLHFWLPSWG